MLLKYWPLTKNIFPNYIKRPFLSALQRKLWERRRSLWELGLCSWEFQRRPLYCSAIHSEDPIWTHPNRIVSASRVNRRSLGSWAQFVGVAEKASRGESLLGAHLNTTFGIEQQTTEQSSTSDGSQEAWEHCWDLVLGLELLGLLFCNQQWVTP